MKIVHVLNSLGRGGAENLVINLAHQMQIKGHQITIVSITNKVEYTDLIDTYNINVVTCGFNGTVFNTLNILKVWGKLQKVIDEIQPDIIHSHIFLSDLLTRALRSSNSKLITTFHRPEPWWGHEKIKKQLKTWLEAVTAKAKTDYFIAVSEEAKMKAIEYLGIDKSRVQVIMNGVDTEFFLPIINEENNKELIVLHVARFYPEKSHELLINAFVQVVNQVPDATLWLVGDGPLFLQMNTLVKSLGMQKHIQFLGLRSDISSLMQNAHVFTLPSSREGLPISMLEAMASGLPAVVTRVGEMSNVINNNENGLLIETGQSKLLSDALIELALDSKLRLRLGGNARKCIEEFYSIEKTATEYLKIYKKVSDNE